MVHPLILASASPSRHALLTRLGVSFRTSPAHLDETPHPRERPSAYGMRISLEKACAVAKDQSDAFVLAADTFVALGARILRKAEDAGEARLQMRLLSGRRHRVYTAIALWTPEGSILQRLAMTHVSFKALDSNEIDLFVRSGEWENVAVYRHEGVAGRFIRHLSGLTSTISGLPLFETSQLLKGVGLLRP